MTDAPAPPTPAGSTIAQWANRQNDNAVQSVNSGVFVNFDLSAGTFATSDAARFSIGGGNPDSTEVDGAGLYLVRAGVVWDTPFAQPFELLLQWDHVTWFSGQTFEDQAPASGSTAWFLEQVIKLPSGVSSVTPAVLQNSGAPQVLLDMYLAIEYIMDYEDQPTGFDPF